jgi:preprotein translocase subunit SecD
VSFSLLRAAAAVSVLTLFMLAAAVSRPSFAADATEISPAVAQARAYFDRAPLVNVRLDRASALEFAEFTRSNVGKTLEIRADDKVIVRARLLEPLLGGELVINGLATVAEAEAFAKGLVSGQSKLIFRVAD